MLGLLLGGLALLYFVSTFFGLRGLHELISPGAYFRTGSPRVTLSFDDGPHPEHTPALLALLERYQVKAVFFVIGERAQAHPELLHALHERGHLIGNHSMSHPRLALKAQPTIQRELEGCQALIDRAVTQPRRWARPPYGARDWRVYRALHRLGLTPMMWSRDSLDWAGLSSERIYQRLCKVRPGDIVLLHDGLDCSPQMIAALARWLPEASQRLELGLP